MLVDLALVLALLSCVTPYLFLPMSIGLLKLKLLGYSRPSHHMAYVISWTLIGVIPMCTYLFTYAPYFPSSEFPLPNDHFTRSLLILLGIVSFPLTGSVLIPLIRFLPRKRYR